MAVLHMIFSLLILTGWTNGQQIITSPSDATSLFGSTADFSCEVEFGSVEVFTWELNNIAVYEFVAGVEAYPGGQDKYSVEQDGRTFTLTVSNLDYDDVGSYTCRVISVTGNANLIVLNTPTISTSAPSPPLEGTIAVYTCEAQFGGPAKSSIAVNHYPTLSMLYEGVTWEGEFHELEPEDPTNYYRFTRIVNATLSPSMNGNPLVCEIKTGVPLVAETASTEIDVHFPVHGAAYTPNKETYSVGEVLNCTAEGNPEPTYIWRNTNDPDSPEFEEWLHITEDMRGSPQSWTCTATNTVDSVSHSDPVNALFSVVEADLPPDDGPGAESWKIAVGVCVPILVIIIGAIVGLVVYTFVLKKKKPQQGALPGNIPMNNTPDGKNKFENRGYKDSMDEEEGYYPDEKVPAFTIHTPNRYQNSPNLPFNGTGNPPPPNFAYQTNLLGTGLGSDLSLPLDDRSPEQVYTKPTPTKRTKSQEDLDGPRNNNNHVSFDQSVQDYDDDDDEDDDEMPPVPPPPFQENNFNDFRPAALPPPDTTV